ncbi:MAG: parallel beta-helix domain-containing protein [Saprospiraceae bacterium]|jgi:parallel beta-helix repeat protein
MRLFAILFLFGWVFQSCQSPKESPVKIDTDIYAEIQQALLDAEPGDTVFFPKGKFEFDRPLSLEGVENVTLLGAGMDATILSFKGQKTGAEGLRITADQVVLQDFTVVDSKGDAIKLIDCDGITIRSVKTTWSGGSLESNGGYGLYPVSSKNVLIEKCEAWFASDAGIYVGQCEDVIVRNNLASGNVAGIEIENCIRSTVYQNTAEGNTGGILIFNLPDLPAGNGKEAKIFQNIIRGNNLKNFAPAGNIVASVPPGTGIILLAAEEVEIFNNEIIDHKTMGVSIASYSIFDLPWEDQEFDPFTKSVTLFNNTYQRKKTLPDFTSDFGRMINFLFPGKPQDIIYDGIFPEGTEGVNPMKICINEKQDDLRFASVDFAHEFEHVNQNISDFACK